MQEERCRQNYYDVQATMLGPHQWIILDRDIDTLAPSMIQCEKSGTAT